MGVNHRRMAGVAGGMADAGARRLQGLNRPAATWLIAIASTIALVTQVVGQSWPFSPDAAGGASRSIAGDVARAVPPPASILRLIEEPDGSRITVKMSRPFTDEQVASMAAQVGMDVLSSFTAFGLYTLSAPSVTVERTGRDGATVFFPKIVTWPQAAQYLAEGGMSLVRRTRDRLQGGWIAQVRLPGIQLQPM